MFSVKNSDLVNGGIIWMFKLDPNVTSLKELGYPKAYIYKGRFSKPDEEYILIVDNTQEIHIPARMNYSVCDTGFYILAPNRSRIIHVINNLAKRPILNGNFNFVASKYLELITHDKPEWII